MRAATIALFSLAGSPGVTTTALALASTWPERVGTVLVESDASGGDIAAWRRIPTRPGLVELAATVRNDTTFAPQEHRDELLRHTQLLPGGQLVCTAPVTADRAAQAVHLLARHPYVLRPATATLTVLDLGRLVPRSPAVHLAAAADIALLVVTDDVAQLKRARETLASLRTGISPLGLVLVSDSNGTEQVARAVGAPVWGRLPLDDRGAGFLRGDHQQTRPTRRPLMVAVRQLAHTLIEQHPSGRAYAERAS